MEGVVAVEMLEMMLVQMPAPRPEKDWARACAPIGETCANARPPSTNIKHVTDLQIWLQYSIHI